MRRNWDKGTPRITKHFMRSQLDGQIDKEHPIQTAREGPTQEKQADTQQPQANGFGTRAGPAATTPRREAKIKAMPR